MENTVSILGKDVSLNELRKDLKIAYEEGHSGQGVFPPKKIEALLDFIDEPN